MRTVALALVLFLATLAGCIAPAPELPAQDVKPGAAVSMEWTPREPRAHEEVRFEASVEGPGDDEVLGTAWIIDGQEHQGENVAHTFPAPGAYKIEVRVRTQTAGDLTGHDMLHVAAAKQQPPPAPAPEPTPGDGRDEEDEEEKRSKDGGARPPWANPDEAKIRPGVWVYGCTTNFIFTSPTNGSVYIGTAAHCTAKGSIDVNTSGGSQPPGPQGSPPGGCDPLREPRPPGEQTLLEGKYPAEVVYNSWHTMINLGEEDYDTCAYNDFMVLKLQPEHRALVNPAMLHYGGPTGPSAPSEVSEWDEVLTHGRSGLRLDVAVLEPREGFVESTMQSDWIDRIYTYPTPGIPGDSGSPVIFKDGRALGVLITGALLPPGANGVTNLAMALDYAEKHAGWRFELATWGLLEPPLLP